MPVAGEHEPRRVCGVQVGATRADEGEHGVESIVADRLDRRLDARERCRARPDPSTRVVIAISPTGVSNANTPSPSVSARATAVATVAWPQKGTSAIGEKYRRPRRRPAPDTNAVSA